MGSSSGFESSFGFESSSGFEAESGFETVLNLEKQTISNLIFSEDYGEALKAFAEKRKPVFKGR